MAIAGLHDIIVHNKKNSLSYILISQKCPTSPKYFLDKGISRLPWIDSSLGARQVRPIFKEGYQDGRYNGVAPGQDRPLWATLPTKWCFDENRNDRDWKGLAYAIGFHVGQCVVGKWDPWVYENHRLICLVSTLNYSSLLTRARRVIRRPSTFSPSKCFGLMSRPQGRCKPQAQKSSIVASTK